MGRVVNAFFRWELNSCEVIVKGDDAYPIDYANASPDLSLVSLNYLFPWAIFPVRWCLLLPHRPQHADQPEHRGLRGDRRHGRALLPREAGAPSALADDYFEQEQFDEFVPRPCRTWTSSRKR